MRSGIAACDGSRNTQGAAERSLLKLCLRHQDISSANANVEGSCLHTGGMAEGVAKGDASSGAAQASASSVSDSSVSLLSCRQGRTWQPALQPTDRAVLCAGGRGGLREQAWSPHNSAHQPLEDRGKHPAVTDGGQCAHGVPLSAQGAQRCQARCWQCSPALAFQRSSAHLAD